MYTLPFVATKKFAVSHKIASVLVIAFVIGGGYWGYQRAFAKAAPTLYVLGTVQRGTITSSVSGSGQVSTTNSVDIQPQASGIVSSVAVQEGDEVHAGQVIARVDDSAALQSLTDAKKQYASDKLQLQQSQAQAPITYQNDQSALVTATQNLQNDYSSSYDNLVTTFLDATDALSAVNDALHGLEFKNTWNADYLLSLQLPNPAMLISERQQAESDYAKAQQSVTSAKTMYQATDRSSSTEEIEALLEKTVEMQRDIAQSLQETLTFYTNVSQGATTNSISLPSAFSTVQNATRATMTTATTNLNTLLADQKSISDAKQALTTGQQTVSLDQVSNPTGANPISLQVAQNSLDKEAQDIASLEADLDKYVVVAPFDGIITVVDAHAGEPSSGAVASISTNTQIADLSLNEVDAAKVQVGQKASLTFDAIDGLTIAGHVASISPVGAVSQGVVSYDVKITFDTQDDRVKPGMTVNAAIITAVKTDTLIVPSGAIKTVGGTSVVQVVDNAPATASTAGGGGATSQAGVALATAPIPSPVTLGISSDTASEVISGLTEGQIIVERTISGAAAPAAASAAPSLFGGGGGARGAGGGAGRPQTNGRGG